MEKVTDEELFNRRWNYYVIRELWKINGRKSPDLYDELRMSKRKYTCLITGDTYTVPQMKELSNKFHDMTGADAEIFNGKALLNIDEITRDKIKTYHTALSMKDFLKGKNVTKKELNEIKKFAKNNLHKELDMCKIEKYLQGDNVSDNKNYVNILLNTVNYELNEFRKNLINKLKNTNYRFCSDGNLSMIEHYIRTSEKYSDTTNIEYIIDMLKKVKISELEKAYSKNKLQDYIDNLKKQYELAYSVMVYYKNK